MQNWMQQLMQEWEHLAKTPIEGLSWPFLLNVTALVLGVVGLASSLGQGVVGLVSSLVSGRRSRSWWEDEEHAPQEHRIEEHETEEDTTEEETQRRKQGLLRMIDVLLILMALLSLSRPFLGEGSPLDRPVSQTGLLVFAVLALAIGFVVYRFLAWREGKEKPPRD